MPHLPYTSKNFPIRFGNAVIGFKSIDVSWAELIHAAITVGKPESSYILKHGVLSRYELLMRVYMLKVNFKETMYPVAYFEQTEVYKSLDPSEKTSLSYFMGLTTAKLLTNRFLGVSWLIHLDSFKKIKKFQKYFLKFNSKKRPDLLGLNSSQEWLVMEAKGRSGKLPKDLIKKALIQTHALDTISNQPPFLRVACASYATDDILFAYWECSKQLNANSNQLNLHLTPFEFLDRYYASIRNLINRENQNEVVIIYGGITYSLNKSYIFEGNPDALNESRVLQFNTVRLPDLDLEIGLLDKPNSFFLEKSGWHEALMSSEQFQAQAKDSNQKLFIAPDGVLILLGSSWNAENMSLEPEERIDR